MGFTRGKKILLVVFLLAISTRVLSGAAEAQVNFTKLLDRTSLTYVAHTESAQPIAVVAKKNQNILHHKFYSSYKKYVSPDKAINQKITFGQLDFNFYPLIIHGSQDPPVLQIQSLTINAPPASADLGLVGGMNKGERRGIGKENKNSDHWEFGSI